MEKSGLTTSFLLIIFLVSLFQSSNGSTLIRQSCMTASKMDPNVINYDFCVSFLEANVKTEPPNITVLTGIALKLLGSTAVNIVSEIPKLLNDPKFSAYAKACLKDCSSMYKDATSDLKDAERCLETKDFAGANIRVRLQWTLPLTVKISLGREAKSLL